MKVWVGSRNLRSIIQVYDAESAAPVPGAIIRMYQEGKDTSSCAGTDARGQYEAVEEVTSTGKEGTFVNTMNVHVPDRLIWVTATGYHWSGLLNMADHRGNVRHFERESELLIRIPLTKKEPSHPEP